MCHTQFVFSELVMEIIRFGQKWQYKYNRLINILSTNCNVSEKCTCLSWKCDASASAHEYYKTHTQTTKIRSRDLRHGKRSFLLRSCEPKQINKCSTLKQTKFDKCTRMDYIMLKPCHSDNNKTLYIREKKTHSKINCLSYLPSNRIHPLGLRWRLDTVKKKQINGKKEKYIQRCTKYKDQTRRQKQSSSWNTHQKQNKNKNKKRNEESITFKTNHNP